MSAYIKVDPWKYVASDLHAVMAYSGVHAWSHLFRSRRRKLGLLRDGEHVIMLGDHQRNDDGEMMCRALTRFGAAWVRIDFLDVTWSSK